MPNSNARWKLAAVLQRASEPVLRGRLAALLLAATLLPCAMPPIALAQSSAVDRPPSERQLARQRAAEREWSRRWVAASQAHANGQWEQAERLARRLVAFDRQRPDGLTLLASVYLAQGRNEDAGRMYRQALALAPQRGDLLNNYGVWLCLQGQAAEALVLFDRAARDGSGSVADRHVNAGICAQRSGQWERAAEDLRQALTFYPAHPGVLEAMAQLQLERGNPMAARAFYQRRLAAAPADASVLQLAIKVEEQLGDKAAAEQHKLRLDQVQGAGQGAESRLINGDH